MNRDCENCENYKTDYDLNRKRFVKTCRAYPTFTVFGRLAGLINPECMKFSPIKATDHKSLAEKTYIRAGGAYNKASEPSRSGLKDLTPWKPLKWNRPGR